MRILSYDHSSLPILPAMPIARTLRLLLVTAAFASSLAAQTGDPEAAAEPKKEKGGKRAIRITMRDGMRFDPARFEAKPGEEISLRIRNDDSTDMAHNFLLLKPGSREEIIQLAMTLGDQGTARHWVPQDPRVLFHTQLIETDRAMTVEFRAPTAPGIYPYVCTFPGHGMIMYGAVYVGVKPPPLDEDKNIPSTAVQATIAGGGQRPFVQRIFMPDASPAAIAVALTGSQNVCWDATDCRLRYAWQGTFIDPTQNWRGNGRDLAQLPTTPWWKAAVNEHPLRLGGATAAPAMKFLGYARTPAGAEFHYRAGNTEVFEQVLPRKEGPGLTLHFRIPRAGGNVTYHTTPDSTYQWSSSAGKWSNGVLTLTAAEAADFTVSLTSALCKL